MLGLILAFVAAVCYAIGIVLAGIAGKSLRPQSVFLASCLIGLLLAGPLLLIQGTRIEAKDILLGIVAGALATFGTVTNIGTMARGKMSVVAPTIGVMIGFVPVLGGVAKGEHLNAFALLAIVIGFGSIVLTSPPPDGNATDIDSRVARKTQQTAIIGGSSVGLEFVVLSYSSSGAAVWMAFAIRLVAITSLGSLGLLSRQLNGCKKWPWKLLAIIGVLLLVGDLSFVAATRHNNLSIVGLIVALNPAIVILIARGFLNERVTRRQASGLCTALASIVLFSLASTH